MATKDAKKIFNTRGGAIKFAPLDAEFPTNPSYVFDPQVWGDLGAIKKQPTLTPDMSTTEVDFWNIDSVTLGSSTKWNLDFSSGQFDFENFKLFFNFEELDSDGGFTPGEANWEGQLAILLFVGSRVDLLHVPYATYNTKGAWDMLKNDAAELASTFTCNPDSRLDGGKPWRYVPGVALTPETIPAGV